MFTRSLAFYIFGGIFMALMNKTVADADNADYVVVDVFHTNVAGPRNKKISVKAFETVNNALTFAPITDCKFFLVADGSYKWNEITKNEFTALRILKKVGDRKMSTICYEPEPKLITIKGYDGFIITSKNSADSIDDFLEVLDAMGCIRNGDLYARFKEAKW